MCKDNNDNNNKNETNRSSTMTKKAATNKMQKKTPQITTQENLKLNDKQEIEDNKRK